MEGAIRGDEGEGRLGISILNIVITIKLLLFQVSKRFMDKTQKERILHALQRLEQNVGKVCSKCYIISVI